MKRSHRFHRGAFVRYVLPITVTGLIFGAASEVNPAAKVMAQDAAQAADAGREPVFSGPQPGEAIKPFNVLRIEGDESKEVEIVKESDDGTTLICFIHKLSTDDRILYGLGLVDFYASRHKELSSHFVLLSDDRPKMMKMIRGWARGPVFTKSLVSVSVDGEEGPGYYGLNRNVAMTVVVANGKKVVSNFVFQAPNNNDLLTIMVAVAKALDEPEPTLAQVQQELRAERQRQQDKRIKASPVFKLAPNEQLGRIMFGMVNGRGNRMKNAERRSQQLLEWAGDDKGRQSTLKDYCKAVLAGSFPLNQYSRAAIQRIVNN